VAVNAQTRALSAARAKAAEELQRAAARDDTPTAQLKELGERLRHLDLALQEHRGVTSRRVLVVAALAVAVLVTILACVPVFLIGVDVEADVEATQVALAFAHDESLQLATLATPVTVEGASRVEIRGRDRTAGGSDLDTVRLEGNRARLERLTVPSGGHLEISTAADTLAFALTSGEAAPATATLLGDAAGGASKGSVELRWLPALDGSAPAPTRESFDSTELIHLSSANGSARPLRIRAPNGTLAWAAHGVREVEFMRPAPSDRLESSVISARLKVGPKATETVLAEGDELMLSGMTISALRIGVCSPAPAADPATSNAACRRLSVHLVGKAGDIQVRQAQREPKSLVPSWLAYLKESHLVSLLWASALFVWGTGWSLWKAWTR
jgi:hypothetical protein